MRRSGRKCQPSVKVSSEDFVTEQNGMNNTAKPSKKRGIKGEFSSISLPSVLTFLVVFCL